MSNSKESGVWNHYIDYLTEVTQIDRKPKYYDMSVAEIDTLLEY